MRLYLYVDGVLQSTNTTTGSLDDRAQPFVIGRLRETIQEVPLTVISPTSVSAKDMQCMMETSHHQPEN